jgi:restriction system protein
MAMWGIHMFQQIGPGALDKGYIAIGWHELGDLSPIAPDREAFKKKYRETYPTVNPNSIPVSAGVLYRFTHEIQVGEYIVYPSSHDSMVNIGQVTSDYYYDSVPPEEFPNRRSVNWLKHVPRLFFSQQSRNEIGAAIALFQVSTNEEEFLKALEGHVTEPETIDEPSAERVSEQIIETTEDFIISRLKTAQTPYQFEHFIAHLLRCMGYQSRVTQATSDGGIDIIAHRDELGFDPPLIKVQVKTDYIHYWQS